MAYSGKVTGPESLGRILQQARMLAGLSQRELATRLGTTQRYIWEIEAGKPSIFTHRLFEFMRETGMDLTATIEPKQERQAAREQSLAVANSVAEADDQAFIDSISS